MTMTHTETNHPESRFSLGQRVTDTNAETDPSMRVLGISDLPAGTFYIKAIGKTVLEANENAEPDEMVYEVAFESHLDRNVPNWETWPREELAGRVKRYTTEWRVPLTTYHYPESRLAPKPEEE